MRRRIARTPAEYLLGNRARGPVVAVLRERPRDVEVGREPGRFGGGLREGDPGGQGERGDQRSKPSSTVPEVSGPGGASARTFAATTLSVAIASSPI